MAGTRTFLYIRVNQMIRSYLGDKIAEGDEITLGEMRTIGPTVQSIIFAIRGEQVTHHPSRQWPNNDQGKLDQHSELDGTYDSSLDDCGLWLRYRLRRVKNRLSNSPSSSTTTSESGYLDTFAHLPNLQELAISTVDITTQHASYATIRSRLVALRIAIERGPLRHLQTLALLTLSPSIISLLNPILGVRVSPNSACRWRQIRRLHIHLHKHTFSSNSIKLLHFYLQAFAATANCISFVYPSLFYTAPTSLTFERHPRSAPLATSNSHRVGLPLQPLSPEALDAARLEDVMANTHNLSAFIETELLASPIVQFCAVPTVTRTLRHRTAKLGGLRPSSENGEEKRPAPEMIFIKLDVPRMPAPQLEVAEKQDNEVEGGIQQSKQEEQDENAVVEPLVFNTIVKERAARIQLAMQTSRGTAKERANSVHNEVRKMLEERAQGCKTPLIDFMWDVDGGKKGVEITERGGLLREPVMCLWRMARRKRMLGRQGCEV